MTNKRKTIAQERALAYSRGIVAGRAQRENEITNDIRELRKGAIVQVSESAALLAKANASLTYSLSRLMEKLG